MTVSAARFVNLDTLLTTIEIAEAEPETGSAVIASTGLADKLRRRGSGQQRWTFPELGQE